MTAFVVIICLADTVHVAGDSIQISTGAEVNNEKLCPEVV